jgi:phosphatidylinositol alpha 1,6-mannosyltransferase
VTDFYLPRLGGIELQVRDLSRRQAADGHLVEVVTATRSGSGGPVSESAGPVTIRRLGARRLLGGTYSPLTLRRISRAVRASKADVVHAHVSSLTLATWWGIRTAVRAGIPVVITATPCWKGSHP